MKKLKNVLIDSIFILIMFVTFNILITKYVAKTELKSKEYIVKSGDTIWSIATDLAEQNSKKYIKSIVNDIKKLNLLDDVIIYEGQEILIPIYQVCYFYCNVVK